MSTTSIRLADIAHGRSGDKGNHANVAVIAYTPAGFAWLREHLTAEVVQRYFAPLWAGEEPLTPDPSPQRGEGRKAPLTPDPSPQRGEGRDALSCVRRFEAPNLLALNFMLFNVLAGGASRSLRSDTQGKTLALALLRMPIEVADIAEMKRPHGRN